MRQIRVIAPGAVELAAAGNIEAVFNDSGTGVATCGQCGEWADGDKRELDGWARGHATRAHDALRPSVVGLDLSLTRAGVAIVSRDPADGSFWPSLLDHVGETGWKDATWDERCDRLVRQLTAVVGIIDAARRGGADIRLGVIEGPSYGHARMPGYYDRAGLWWPVYAALRKRGIAVAVVTPDHRAKFICGVKPPSGDAGKRLVLDETRARWTGSRLEAVVPDPARLIANHDQADALGLAEMGVLGAKWSVPWQVRRRHVENVALTPWPAVVA